MNRISYQLEIFRENYHSIRVSVYSDYMVYKVKIGCGKRAAVEANEVIEKLGLPLVAIPTTLLANDSFIVQSNETEV